LIRRGTILRATRTIAFADVTIHAGSRGIARTVAYVDQDTRLVARFVDVAWLENGEEWFADDVVLTVDADAVEVVDEKELREGDPVAATTTTAAEATP
jgi:hypothetical protein